MSYETQTWKGGETITAERLNHMEDGIASAGGGGGAEPLIVRFDHNDGDYWYYDKTWQEIYNATLTSSAVIIEGQSIYKIQSAECDSNDARTVWISKGGGLTYLVADSIDGYVYSFNGAD